VWCSFAAFFIAFSQIASADDAQNKNFIARAEAEFNRTQKTYETSANATNAIAFARACFDYADLATNNGERATIAHQGINACRTIITNAPRSAPAHYYLGMNLGELARTEFMGALRIVREMEREFKTAASLDPKLDYAGPELCLGLLYRDAPGWPASIGNNRKARSYLQQAVDLAPDYPENILTLAESDLQWRDTDAAQKESDTLDQLWPKAQKQFIGDPWAQNWADWTTRREALHQNLSAR
jgi:hypothetical protein